MTDTGSAPRASARSAQARPAVGTLLAAMAAGWWLGGAALAQHAGSSSESHVQTGQNLPAGGGETASTSFTAESELGFSSAGDVIESAGYRFTGGAVWTDGAYAVSTDTPIVFGVAQGYGDHDGGETELVFGFNFDAPGGGAETVRFDGVDASGTTAIGNTVLSTVTPVGENSFGNPKALVGVEVENAGGLSQAPAAYVYTPGITILQPAVIGQPWRLDYYAAPNSLYGFALGKSFDSIVIPLPPFDGSLELIYNVVQLLGATFTPSGFADFTLFVPGDPSLVGFTVEIQGLAVETVVPTLTGAWSNRLATVIQ